MTEFISKRLPNIKNDVLSGITVALALVPEAVAFAFVAGVDPLVGLYAAFMVGLINEIAGEGGMAWNARLLMFHAGIEAQGQGAAANPMYAQYQYDADTISVSREKIESLLVYLAVHIKAQSAKESHFLVGDQLTAADVYWAYFSNMLEALPPQHCPMPGGLRDIWGVLAKSISGYDPVLIEQRDRILTQHLALPLDF